MPPPTVLTDAPAPAAAELEAAGKSGGPVGTKRSGDGERFGGERLSGLDGLRAIAVVVVVLFHLDSSLVPGGFLGVDVFFVISGFLITRLLLTELHRSGTSRLGRVLRAAGRGGCSRRSPCWPSWSRPRSVFVWRDELATLRGSVLSSLGYVTNWWLIFDHQSYFASHRPAADAAAPVVAGDRGAVLPGLAARDPARHRR